MATRFLARPLQVLDRIYRFLEGQSPTLVELSQPVQLVHDVSRETELGSALMGFFLAGQDQVHAGADTQENTWDPYDQVLYLFPNLPELWVWLFRTWAVEGANILSAASLVVGTAPYGEGIPRRDIPLAAWSTGYFPIYDQNVAPANLPNAVTLNATQPLSNLLPFPIFPGSTMRSRSTSTGAGTVRIEGLFWAGPMGTLPPGF